MSLNTIEDDLWYTQWGNTAVKKMFKTTYV